MGRERIAALTATNPVRAMGLGHVKGATAPGRDADFAVIDPAARWTVTRDGALNDAAVGTGRCLRRHRAG